ncbi:hypothetical protein M8J76_001964 [Diaphorina citri]|nr:hypothetical protein M8J76_001964 [Diaphorina citri]
MAFFLLSVFIPWILIVSCEEQLSYVVTSKPYYIQANDNVNKIQRDFSNDNIGENEISETMENLYTDCELNNSCGHEDTRAANFDATFKPFPQDELEKILKKYGKDKMSDRISSSKGRPSNSNEISSSLSFHPVTTENTFDKSKSWSLLTSQTNDESKDSDRVGWVTLEPVAWSTSQIQKWKPSIQSVLTKEKDSEDEDDSHWNTPAPKPHFDSLGWNPNKHPWHSAKPSQDNLKPDYEFEKPSNLYLDHKYEPLKTPYEPMKHVYDPLKPTYDPLKPIYDSLKPTYDPIQPTLESIQGAYDKPAYNPIKPTLDALGLTYDSGKPSYESIKPNLEFNHKPYWNLNQNYDSKPTVTKIQPAWNSPISSDGMPQIITSHNQDQFASYLQSQQQKPAGLYEQNNHISMQGGGGGDPGDNDGHWVLLSSTREYSGPDRQRNLSRSLKSKEIYRNSIPLTITALKPESLSKKISRAIDHNDYKNYVPLTSSSSNGTEYRRKSIPLIITAPSLNKQSHSHYDRQERKLEPFPQEESNNSRTARRMVRLTVLPPVNGSNVVTSHNGMIEVENTKLTVDESHREHVARMMKLERQNSGNPFEAGSRMQRDTTSLPSNKMTMMLPIVIGRRRRRFEPNHLNYYPRNILTATH